MNGVFSQTNPSPSQLPSLSCDSAGEIGTSSTIISGIFRGNHVAVASCIGNSAGGVFVIGNGSPQREEEEMRLLTRAVVDYVIEQVKRSPDVSGPRNSSLPWWGRWDLDLNGYKSVPKGRTL